MIALSVQGLRYSYVPNRKRKEDKSVAEVLQGLSFEVRAGRLTAILGPNGSGKSTSFKILSTQLKASEGSAQVFGLDIQQKQSEVRATLGVTFQSPSLDPLLTVQENLEIFAALYGLDRAEAKSRISELLKVFDIEGRAKSLIKELSGGLARRVELAKALLPKPKLLMLDEPTAGLDPKLRQEFWRELARLRDSGMSILVTTHLMDEADLCDDLIFINEGRCAASGTPQRLKEEFGGEVVEVSFRGDSAALAPKFSTGIGSLLVAGEKSTLKSEASLPAFKIETSRGPELLNLLLKQWGAEIAQISLGKPTLADVYFSKTGKALG